MKNTSLTLALLFVILIIPLKSLAWGKQGHAMVAEVAFKYLDENTKKIVLQYLDGMSIEEAANWMDDIKSDHNYDYMKPFHYVNFEKGEVVQETEGNNIISILNKTIKELQHKNNLSKAEIKTKLLMLFHLIGDLHQPLHVGYGSDRGGNTVQINFRGKGTNLHALWDFGIIEYKNISLRKCLNSNTFSNNDFTQLQEINIVLWAKESNSFLDTLYNFDSPILSRKYVKTSSKTIETQILKAGIRLAAVLKEVLKS